MKNVCKILLFAMFIKHGIGCLRFSNHPLSLSCKANYQHIIELHVKLEPGVDCSSLTFTYKRENSKSWVIGSCVRNNDNFGCDMKIDEDLDAQYEIRFTMKEKSGARYNLTNLRFIESSKEVNPWSTRKAIESCTRTKGVKYVIHFASTDSITTEVLRYPLDVKYQNLSDIFVLTKGKHFHRKERLSDIATCRSSAEEICTFTQKSLKPCVEYEVCIEKDGHKKCRKVSTTCTTNSIRWQDVLLIVFGGLICAICLALFRMNTTRGSGGLRL